MFGVNSNAVRYTGRWNVTDEQAVTTAPGGIIEIAFEGNGAVIHFDIDTNQAPYPHLWIIVDNGAKVETPLDRFLRIETKESGNHIVKIIFKGAVEYQHRWYAPLIGKVSFCGFEAEKEGVLPEDNRKTIEFIGDSITEGVLIDFDYAPERIDQLNRVYQDDVTATYAYLTAEALDLKPIIMGYGAVGITKAGQGAVPRVSESYQYCYHNAPMDSCNADYIVINHGTNDMPKPPQEYIRGMEELLTLVRSRNLNSKIAVMVPFYGCFRSELSEFIPRYNKENNDNIFLIDTTGWIPQTPIHPVRTGHKIAADKLIEILKKWMQ